MNSRTYLPAALATLSTLVFPWLSWAGPDATTVGFEEKFALATDREKALAELVPGSEDYYYFHALHFQNTRNEPKLAAILQQWKQRFPDENARRRIIENREALLDYETSPKQTLAYLKERLNVTFTDQRQARNWKPNLPTALDAKRISREVFEREALALDEGLATLSIDALETLVRNKVPLNSQQRRAVLDRLERPDVPGLVELLTKELKSEDTEGFGHFSIGQALLPEQLEALAKAVPDLATTDEYIHTRLRKLAPSADVKVDYNPAEREAWLDRLWAYAKPLPPAFNTIKTHILYRCLEHDRKKGVYDAARFLEYLKLPREAEYANEKWLEKARENGESDLNADLSDIIPGGAAIGRDEALVRDYFLAIFQQAAAANPAKLGESLLTPYTPYVRASWLKPVLAESLILGGHSSPERWAAWLSPEAYQALKERVEIELPPTNAPAFAPGTIPQFEVVLKNTPKLLVRIYEINTLNFYLTQHRQLNTDLNVDGLVANREQTYTFETGPLRRTRQTLQFPELKDQRGAWLIELVGGGRSSRALLRSGTWQVIQQAGPAGDLLLVLDEKSEPVRDAVAWLDGRKYTTDAKFGRIAVPHTNQPGRKALVIGDAAGTYGSLTEFEHHAETYVLDAQFHIAREQLLSRRPATLAVRATLMMGESHLDPSLILEPKLTITSVTHDGISTTREIKDCKLSAGGVLTETFAVPDRLASLTATISGQVQVLSNGGEKRDVSASHTWSVNGIDETEATSDSHLSKFAGNYVYELLGKNGEPRADQPIVFIFHHHGFTRTQQVELKTDEKGRVALGPLTGLDRMEAQLADSRGASWDLAHAARTHSSTLHARVGEPVRIPALVAPDQTFVTTPAAYSLLQMTGDTFVADLTGKIQFADGFLVLEGLAPGDYSLRLRPTEEVITIKITAGPTMAGWTLGRHRHLQSSASAPLQITSVAADPEIVTVKLAHVTPFTRVHVAASRFVPAESMFAGLGGFQRYEPGEAEPAERPNLYSAGREIGDEYRYILERRAAKLFPGNLLARPGLLLNPWTIRDTGLAELAQKAGEDAAKSAGERGPVIHNPTPEEAPISGHPDPAGQGSRNLDFLANSSPAIYNLLPDADGVVRFDRKALGDRQHVQIYVEDLHHAAWRSFALPEIPTSFTDLRLSRNLPPDQPITQKREITVLTPGRTLTVADVTTSEIETYDTLGRVHALLNSLNPEPTWQQFAWILEWPKFKDAEKRAKYSEFACHELNFFLLHKDPEFFRQVIKPALANKKDKTFMDDFLLERDLAGYLEPWAYGRLNVVERTLLGRRIAAEAAASARHLREQWELLPSQTVQLAAWFETALRGRAMDVSGVTITGAFSRGRESSLPAAEMNAPVALAAAAKPARAADATVENFVAEVKQKANRGLSLTENESIAVRSDTTRFAKELEELPALRQVVNRAEALGESLSISSKGDLEAGNRAIDHFSFFGAADTKQLRELSRAYYRTLGPTQEWAENHYYRLRIAEQNAQLVKVNAYWRDYAAWLAAGGQGAFVSPNIAEAHHNFTEMMLALAVLDLPFEKPRHTSRTNGNELIVTAGGPVIIFHREMKTAAPPAHAPQGQLLVSQSFFRHQDRYRMEGNEKFEKYVTAEFLTGVVYGASVVATNPTSAPVKADVLLQIPKGALPVLGSKATDSRSVHLAPYTTQTFEYHFYFPATSEADFPHFPVNIAVGSSVVSAAKPFAFHVVNQLTQIDKASWDYLSQDGSEADVFAYLEKHNLSSLDLNRLAWRCHDAAFFKKLTAYLTAHHVWNAAIYRYALVHNDPEALREWLKRQDAFLSQCGPWLSTKLILLDPLERRAYEHLEYSPLVNQRAHRLGNETRIANPAVLSQYRSLMQVLSHKPALDSVDNLSVSYYLFLQDRVEEALPRFHSVDAKLLPTQIQHDYFRCYADFYEGTLGDARTVAAKYAGYPVPRWQKLFASVTAQLDELEGKIPAKSADGVPDRETQQAALAHTEPAFDFKVENKSVALTYQNLEEVTVNYYLMDPEFSFSSNPFVSSDTSRFSIIQPTKTATQALAKNRKAIDLALPAEFAKANVLVEVVGAGQRKAQAYHANTLKLTLTENYGRLEVRDATTDRPAPQAYVKVYARLKDGTVRFFKDGYTDLRGRFDYASLSGGAGPIPVDHRRMAAPANGLDYPMLKPAEFNQIDKMAILVMSREQGATTREVAPPRQ